MEAEMKNVSLNVETKPKKDLFKKMMAYGISKV